MAFPKKETKLPRPVLIVIHGGGFISGNKDDKNSQILKFTKLGFVAASAMYRLAPEHKFPDQLEDIKLAIRHIKANAAKYHIDPERIILSGYSAGSYLAVMAGVTGNSKAFSDHGLYSDYDSTVRAVAAQSSPIGDFSLEKYVNHATVKRLADSSVKDFEALLQSMSPVTYLDPEDPPMFLSHGDKDAIVPVDMSREFVYELRNIGHFVEYHEVAGGTHSLSSSAPKESKSVFRAFINFVLKWAE